METGFIYETYTKLENGRWRFAGWCKEMNEEFCIETKVKGKYIIKTYKWLTGEVQTFRYNDETKLEIKKIYEHL